MNRTFALARSWRLVQLLVLLAIVYHLFVGLQTPYNLMADASGDDGLFISHARGLLSGDYLGGYNGGRQAKGPGYGLFLAASHLTGLPASFTHAAFFLSSLGFFAFAVARLFRSRILGVAIFVLCAMHPMFPLERFLRDSIYTSQVLLILGCLIFATISTPARATGWGIAAGLAFGWFWITREEGIWLVPAVLLLLASVVVRHATSRQMLAAGAVVAGFAGGFLVPQLAYRTANLAYYGYFYGVDIKEPNFTRAFSLVQSVRDGEQIPYVPVSKSTRAIIYEASPTFALMKKSLDPQGRPIVDHGCRHYPHTCGDYAGGWFIWHFRQAAMQAGAISSPREASAFYGRLGDEIEAACETGKLSCASSFVPYMPRVSSEQVANALPILTKVVRAVVWASVSPMRNSTGTPRTQGDALEVLNYPLVAVPREEAKVVEVKIHWIADAVDVPRIAVIGPDGKPVPQTLVQAAAPAPSKDKFVLNYEISAQCGLDCRLRFGTDGTTYRLGDFAVRKPWRKTPLGQISIQANMKRPPLANYLTVISDTARNAASTYVYGPLALVLAPVGLVLFAVVVAVGAIRRRYLAELAVVCAAWAVVAVRIVLISAIELSAFPAAHKFYLGPAIVFLLPACLLTLFLAWRMFRERVGKADGQQTAASFPSTMRST